MLQLIEAIQHRSSTISVKKIKYERVYLSKASNRFCKALMLWERELSEGGADEDMVCDRPVGEGVAAIELEAKLRGSACDGVTGTAVDEEGNIEAAMEAGGTAEPVRLARGRRDGGVCFISRGTVVVENIGTDEELLFKGV